MTLVRIAGLSAGVLQDVHGNAIINRPVNVYLRDTTTTVQVYLDEAGSLPAFQPLVTDNSGDVPGFVAGGVSIDIVDVLSGLRMQAEPVAANAIGVGFAPGWGVPQALNDRALERVSVMDNLSAAERADVTSHTGSIDIRAKIQAIVDYLAAHGSGEIEAPSGVYGLAGMLNMPGTVTLVGAGSGDYTTTTGTVFKCLASGAGLQFGSPTVAAQAGGSNGGFKINGNSLATQPLTFSTVGGYYFDIKTIASAGDGFLFDGAQNNMAVNCMPAHANGCGVAFDRGASSNLLVGWEIQQCSSWLVEFRMTNNSGFEGSIVPSYNRLFRCGIETPGSATWGTTGTGLVHQLAGANNSLVHCGMFDGARTVPADTILLEANSAIGRGSDANNRFKIENCGIVGSSNHTNNVNAVHIAGTLAGDMIYFVGHNNINNYGTGVLIDGTSAANVWVDGHVLIENCGTSWSGGSAGIFNQVKHGATGRMFNQLAGNEFTTASTGANGAPPAQVVGYLAFVDSAGVQRKIPYYAT